MTLKQQFVNFIDQTYNTTFLPDARLIEPTKQQLFKQDMLEGLDKILLLKDKYYNKPALVMGLGPTLFDIDQNHYTNCVKLTCNHFHRVPNFFTDSFKPDFWCAANSYGELKDPFTLCMQNNIQTFVTIPIRIEFFDLLNISRQENKMHLVNPWMWEQQIFQNLLAAKYNITKIYSRCNTITNHMIAFALWLGCNPISVTGFDLSYKKALKNSGTTHAGFNDDWVEDDDSVLGNNAFDEPAEKRQIINDLKYLCTIANHNKIKINNLSHNSNKLPKRLA